MRTWTFSDFILVAFVAEICLWLSSEFLRSWTGADQPLPLIAAGAVALLAGVGALVAASEAVGRPRRGAAVARDARPRRRLAVVASASDRDDATTIRRAA
jgi:hypothetical protein